MASSQEEADYEVEGILDERTGSRGKEYLVLWKGYTTDEVTWEPAKGLANCAAAISVWEATSVRHALREQSRKRPREREEACATNQKQQAARKRKQKYDESDIGRRLKVRFTGDKNKPWYAGIVAKYHRASGEHTIHYDDGDVKAHSLVDEEAHGQLKWLSVASTPSGRRRRHGEAAAAATRPQRGRGKHESEDDDDDDDEVIDDEEDDECAIRDSTQDRTVTSSAAFCPR